MTTDDKKHFVMLATCEVVRGAKRSLLVDYAHNITYYISNDYERLIRNLNGKALGDICNQMDDDESRENFRDFVNSMLLHEMAVLTEDPSLFPPLSKDLNDECLEIIDAIVEVDQDYSATLFNLVCSELTTHCCKELQVRQLTLLDLDVIESMFSNLQTTDICYLELHATYNPSVSISQIKDLVEKYAILQNIYLYNAPETMQQEVVNQIEGYESLSLGHIFYVDYPFDQGECCGRICLENLDFSGYATNNLLRKKNGCLYKKVCIDTEGNIKNCPSMPETYGNIRDIHLEEVLINPAFTRWWVICKDKVEVCKDCEFRYNCTDCRAFRVEKNNIYSKPLKCSYDPYSCDWK